MSALRRLARSNFPLIIDNSTENPLACLTLISKLGTKYEDTSNSGMNLACKILSLTPASYEFIQQSGGTFNYSFDQEYSTYCLRGPRANFAAYAKLLIEIIQRPKTVLEEMEAATKIKEFIKAKDKAMTPEEHIFNMWLPTVYGMQGLGMPLHGLQTPTPEHSAKDITGFAARALNSERSVLVASNVPEQEAFDVLSSTIEALPLPMPDVSSKYKGGQNEKDSKTGISHHLIAYEGAAAISLEHYVFEMLRECFNTVSFGGSQRHQHFLHSDKVKQLMGEHPFVRSFQIVNASFEDSGSFGFQFSVFREGTPKIKDFVMSLMDRMFSLSEEDIQHAKERLKVQLLRSLEPAESRAQELGRMFLLKAVEEPPNLNSHLAAIDSLGIRQIQSTLVQMNKSPMTVISNARS